MVIELAVVTIIIVVVASLGYRTMWISGVCQLAFAGLFAYVAFNIPTTATGDSLKTIAIIFVFVSGSIVMAAGGTVDLVRAAKRRHLRGFPGEDGGDDDS